MSSAIAECNLDDKLAAMSAADAKRASTCAADAKRSCTHAASCGTTCADAVWRRYADEQQHGRQSSPALVGHMLRRALRATQSELKLAERPGKLAVILCLYVGL